MAAKQEYFMLKRHFSIRKERVVVLDQNLRKNNRAHNFDDSCPKEHASGCKKMLSQLLLGCKHKRLKQSLPKKVHVVFFW